MKGDGVLNETELQLIPGNYGKDCPGNGERTDQSGFLFPANATHAIICCVAWKVIGRKSV